MKVLGKLWRNLGPWYNAWTVKHRIHLREKKKSFVFLQKLKCWSGLSAPWTTH